MACCDAEDSCKFLSDEGIVYGLGEDFPGGLGVGIESEILTIPTPIQNLPPIKLISCGAYFTACVDVEGFLWTFGDNIHGQLGIGNKTSMKIPQKIQNIPPIQSVCCGHYHTLVITNDSNLWSFGLNDDGQLCLGNTQTESRPKQTTFSDILKISGGGYHSLFQNNYGEIYACGYNQYGELGLGKKIPKQIEPTLIPNLPSDIIQFDCGTNHSLFLDILGNVYSVGYNYVGSLGNGSFQDTNELNQILNIPPIQSISCIDGSNYLIDFDDNVWSFGDNEEGQLGHDDRRCDSHENSIPTKIDELQNIKQISSGFGRLVLMKDSSSPSNIFLLGNTCKVLESAVSSNRIQILDPKYCYIWGEELSKNNRTKSARK